MSSASSLSSSSCPSGARDDDADAPPSAAARLARDPSNASFARPFAGAPLALRVADEAGIVVADCAEAMQAHERGSTLDALRAATRA